MTKKKQLVKSEEPTTLLRTAPANVQAEQMVIGAIMINNEAMNRVSEFLRPEHFYEPVHQKIYNAINLILDKGISATPISLKSMLSGDDQFEHIGGGDYLSRLATVAMTVINVNDYGRIIYDLYLRRELIAIGEDMVNIAYSAGLDNSASDQIEHAEHDLFALASEGMSDKGFIDMKESVGQSLDMINRAMKSSDHITGISLGLTDMDRKLSGFQNSDLVIIAGRPSMGKTAFAMNFALNCCRSLIAKHKENKDVQPPSVGFFSLEMSSEQLTTRILSMQTNLDSSALRSGRVGEEHYNQLRKEATELAKLPLFIDDTPALSIAAIRTRARRLKRKHNLGILFIDYLQLIRGSSNKVENRVLEISEITQGLKALAKELNIPIIALSQLSRAVEQREDKRPMLSDLRESGSIEQDADIVMFLYREEYYLTRKEPTPGTPQHSEWFEQLSKVHNLAEVIIAKHRNGPVGIVQLFYDASHSKIGNYQQKH